MFIKFSLLRRERIVSNLFCCCLRNFQRGTPYEDQAARCCRHVRCYCRRPALANFWIVRDSPTGKCRIVDLRPTDTKILIVGNKTYTVRTDADKDLAVVCKG